MLLSYPIYTTVTPKIRKTLGNDHSPTRPQESPTTPTCKCMESRQAV